MGLDRITVPVVLVNPDGGSFSISYDRPIFVNGKAIRGYTYVVPTSNPRITKITPTTGPVNGGNTVEIQGSDFRFSEDKTVLPEVYFGTKKAEIDVESLLSGYMQVKVPTGTGVVDVFVINNDAGMSNKIKYTYRSSSPTIRNVSPNTGNRIGGNLIEVEGTGFEQGEITILKPSGAPSTLETMPLVKFGNRTNKDLKKEQENSGVIYGGTTVTLAGGVTVNYTSSNEALTVTIRDRGKDYRGTFMGVGSESVFINTRDLQTSDNEAYPYEELIQFRIVDNRLIVDGGYSPDTILRSERQITARIPFYHTVGKVDLYVINPDGGQARSSFDYRNPDSRPTITNVLRDGREPEVQQRNGYVGNIKVVKVNHKGGNVIEIEGTDFRQGARVQVSNLTTVNYPNLKFDSDTKLTFTMPAVPESQVGTLHRVIVLNEDGGVATSDQAAPPIYIEFIKGESAPRIDKITPDKGPASGGTRVKIEGQDFRRTMDGFEENTLSVLFGGTRVEFSASNNNIEYIDYKTIFVRVPASTNTGQVDVRLENPDGELSNVGKFTYISKPVITNITPDKLFRNDNKTEVQITGNSFKPGAKVVVGGQVIGENDIKIGMEVRGKGISGVNSSGENINVAVVGGIEPASITVKDNNTIIVKFNVTDKELETTNVIVINPDGGISDPYNNFKYEIPVPDKPLVLEAIPGFESTMKLMWSKSNPEILNASDRYEIYAKRQSDNQYSFVGVTKEAEFLIRGLQPGTMYNFRVRALNSYGAAVELADASARTLNESQDHKLREKQEELEKQQQQQNRNGKEELIDGRAVRTIGTQEFPRLIDFTLSKYKEQNKFTVAIPLSIIENYPGDITIRDAEATFRFRPRDLYTREVISVPRSSMDDAFVRVNFEPVNSNAVSTAIQRTQLQASSSYDLTFELQVGRNITAINPVLRDATLGFRFDSRAYPRVDASKIFFGKYNASRNEFIPVNRQVTAVITERGRYMLVANR